jgi:hypothetical protein
MTLSLKHALRPMQYFRIDTICKAQRSTAHDSSDHSAASNADKQVYLKQSSTPARRTP